MSLIDAWRARQNELRDRQPIRPDLVTTREHGAVEVRDPVAATTLTKYQTPGTPQIPEWNAEAAIRQAYLIDVVVARCVQIRAQTIASVPFRAGPDPDKASDYNPNAPLARLLGPAPDGPAPKLSSQVWWEWVVAQRILTGRWGSEIEATPSGEVVALWPLASAYLRAVPTSKGSDWWSGFTYGRDHQPKKLNADQVLYGWDPSPLDFREPYSVLQSARLAVSVAVMVGRYNYGFLKNDAKPAAIVVTEEFESDEEFRRFKNAWRGEYGGPDNAGKMHFLETDPDRAKPSEALNVFTLGLSQKDARLIEQEKAALDHVAIALGVPWSKLDASGRTFDNASQEDISFWEGTVLPDLMKFADEINQQLAPRLGSDIGWFDLSRVRALRPQSKFSRLVDALSAHDRAIVTTNEVRDEIDLPPIDGGDELTPRQLAALEVPAGGGPLAAAQGTPLAVAAGADVGEARVLGAGELDATGLDHPALPPVRSRLTHSHAHVHSDGTMHTHEHSHGAGTADHDHFDQVPHTHGHPEVATALVGGQRALTAAGLSQVYAVTSEQARILGLPFADKIAYRDESAPLPVTPEDEPPPHEDRAETDDEARERRARTWRAADATTRTLEARWAKAMRKLFARQQKAVLSRLEGNRGRRAIADGTPNPDELFDPEFWTGETADDVTALYELVASSGFARVSQQFGITFDLEAPFAQDFIEARSNQLAGQVTETTYGAIQDALAAGIGEGESIPDLAQRIRDVFDIASTSRSTMIARTETISAYNGSSSLAAQQLPDDVVGGQEWIAELDDRVRDAHADADGQVIGMDEAFVVDGEELAYPGDPGGSPDNVVNCRCTNAFLTPEELADRGARFERRVSMPQALTALALVAQGSTVDELALRRALKEAAA